MDGTAATVLIELIMFFIRIPSHPNTMQLCLTNPCLEPHIIDMNAISLSLETIADPATSTGEMVPKAVSVQST